MRVTSSFENFDGVRFTRLGVTLQPNRMKEERGGILNPACARLSDGSLQLYPRMVAAGNISRIGSFRARENASRLLVVEQQGYALEPQAPYEMREGTGGYGCEDPRVTYIAALDRYAMAYVAFGPRGPEVAVAISRDGLQWDRLGLVRFQEKETPFADKDAAFFPEPVRAPSGTLALALYHRPTLQQSLQGGPQALQTIASLPAQKHEGISIAYAPLDDVLADVTRLCAMTETHRLAIPPANWGTVKVGAGTPPVRIREGWMSIVHGVDVLPGSKDGVLRYCAGLVVHDADCVERVLYRSQDPLFVPEVCGEISGAVRNVVFPTAIDPLPGGRSFDVYYGMGDYEIGRGRLTLP